MMFPIVRMAVMAASLVAPGQTAPTTAQTTPAAEEAAILDVKEKGTWRIGNMMWTVEPDACAALRPSDPARIRPRQPPGQ